MNRELFLKFWLRFIHMPRRAGLGFMRHEAPLRACALGYSTLVSLVPVLALAFSMAKGLGAGRELQNVLQGTLAQLPPQVADLLQRIFQYVDRTNFTTLGAVGALMLIWTLISILGSVEAAFNAVWGVRAGRTMARRFTDYLSVIVVVPLLLIASTSAMAMLASTRVTHAVSALGPEALQLYRRMLGCSGSGGVVAAFTLFYLLMPNCRVRFLPALGGGAIAGILWLAVQWVYVKFQVGVMQYNTVYGAFASVPMFLAWMYTGWLVVLLGVEICRALQEGIDPDPVAGLVPATRQLSAAFRICAQAAGSHQDGRGPWTAASWRGPAVEAPLLPDVLERLVAAGVLVRTEGKTPGYLPACSPAGIPLDRIAAAVMPEAGADPDAVTSMVGLVHRQAFSTLCGRTLQDLLDGPPPRA